MYHGYWGQNTMGRGVKIQWLGGRYTMGREVKIPWVGDRYTNDRGSK